MAVIAAAGLAGWWWQQRWRPAQLSRAAVERADELMRRNDPLAAASELQRAIQLDSRNAEAYSVLAHALNRQGGRDPIPRPAGPSPSVEAATRGVAIDPACGPCRGTLGFFLFYHDWEWARGEAELRQAIQLSPDRESIRAPLAMLLAATGRGGQALEQINGALEKQPYNVGWHSIRVAILYLERRYAESVVAADQALAINDRDRSVWEWRSRALLQMGRGEEALKALAAEAFAAHAADLDRAVRAGGADDGLRKLLEITGDFQARVEQSWRRACWRAHLDDQDGALEELERAFEVRNVNLVYVARDPAYDRIRRHPRFQRVLEAMGLKAHGAD